MLSSSCCQLPFLTLHDNVQFSFPFLVCMVCQAVIQAPEEAKHKTPLERG